MKAYQCSICKLSKHKFQCVSCTVDQLTRNSKLVSAVKSTIEEIIENITEIAQYEVITQSRDINLVSFKENCIANDSKTLSDIKSLILQRQKTLAGRDINGASKSKDSAPAQVQSSISQTQSDIEAEKTKLEKLKSQLQNRRKVMVQSLLDIFRLRKVARSTKSGIPAIELRVLNCGMPALSMLHQLPQNRWYKYNSCIAHCVHMLQTLSVYLNITLPYTLQLHPLSVHDPSKSHMLTLTASHQEDFIDALSLFNYNVYYACASQVVTVDIESSTCTLEMLASLLSSADLGKDDVAFTCAADYSEVREVHFTQWKSRPWEIVDGDEDAWYVPEEGT
jgi:Vacuolar sorting 38 and autophagy-related subunit 14